MDMEIYRCDELNRKLYESLPKTSHECIYNPTYVLGARKCYLALKNADYSSQGAFFYDLVIGYYSAHDWLSVDTNAPAYRAQTTIQRKILKELYERIDLPRPPEDFQRSGQRVQPGESVVWGTAIHVGTFVKEYEKFLEVSEVAAMLGQIAHKASRTVVAEEYGNLAKAAQSYKLFDDAERIYLKSAGAYSKLEDKKLEVGVLDNLANMYTEQGKKNAAKKILNRIKKIVG
jgi:tetratricopeptide (TPR) repeat protein